jgi:TaqI-like C-terminal specificity domain/Eco57I restriction-modification methylase/N-6 DNA Methylase
MSAPGSSSTIRTEGGLLPPEFLERLTLSADVPGLTPDAYHLPGGEKVNEAASRAWNRLLGVWAAFKLAADRLPDLDPATGVTREKWLLPLFAELGYGRLQPAKAVELDGRSYPVSHAWQHVPIHLIGRGIDLDRRTPGVAGAARTSPHGLVQDFLNRRRESLWGFVSNGLKLRLLRDNRSLTRQAYVEFDLADMMDGQAFADFVLLWLLCHQSRLEGDPPDTCWLERWAGQARDEGTRALDELRDGVERSIEALGAGFLKHPANAPLLDRLRSGALDGQEYYRQLLRLVYRLIFLFVAEARGLLLVAEAGGVPARRYRQYYSATRLRDLARLRRGTPHGDLWQSLRVVLRALSSDHGVPDLGLPALGSFLWSAAAAPDLDACKLANLDLLKAIRQLAFRDELGLSGAVDWRNLGPEELGSVYESLLELHPDLNAASGAFALRVVAGHERKTTGSYYTPTALVECLLDTALDPVLDEAARARDPARAILDLKVVDPACGSGHFLIAAAHRMARRLAAVRTGDAEASPEAVRSALREVIGHCLFGVDVNPMAVELCKVNLWLEALEPGRPLSFLEHRIQHGNALLGATPALLRAGIPDEAFDPIEGDDRAYCRELKKRNKHEREGFRSLFTADPWQRLGDLAVGLSTLDDIDDSTLEGVHQKEARYAEIVRSTDYAFGRLWADAWCAAFVWPKTREVHPVTEDLFRTIETNPKAVPQAVRQEIQRIAREYRFFHWHLGFPDVFRTPASPNQLPEGPGWSGGFDVVLGNPPWIRQELLKPIKQLLPKFRAFSSTADSSVYFIELASFIARPLGRVAMLTPNKWFRASYAKNLRTILRDRCRINLLIDFGHSRNLFPAADTFPAIVVYQPVAAKVDDTESVVFVRAHDSDREHQSLPELIRSHAVAVPHGSLRDERWNLEGSEENDLLDRLVTTGQPLEAVLRRPILRGLLTGFNEAFYLNTSTKDGILASHPASGSLFRKFLRGRDVKRWVPEWNDQWHIVIPSSQNRTWPWSAAASEAAAEAVFAQTYPSVHDHLKRFEEHLRARQDKGEYWWELRACDYYEEFDKPKILVQCIAYYSQFAFDDAGHYINNKAILIPTDDLYVAAILNSRTTWWIVNRTFQHMKDEGLSVDVQFLRRLPIPTASEELRADISKSASALINAAGLGDVAAHSLEVRLNELVERAFALTDSERSILIASLPPRDPLEALNGYSSHRSRRDVLGGRAATGA